MEREKHPISVRLNGKEQRFEEISAAREKVLVENDVYTPLPSKKRSPKIIDLGRKMKERKNREQPFWDDGNRERIPKLPFKKRKKKRRDKSSFSFKSLPLTLIIAGISAIVVGISFGFMILTLFTSGEEGLQQSIPVEAASAVPDSGEFLPDLRTEVIQGGAFSTIEKGNEIASSIKNKGQAAVLTTTSEPYFLFIGVGKDRGEASIISQLYEQDGQETYMKPFVVAGNHIQLEPEQNSYMAEGIELFQTVLSFSVQGLNGRENALTTDIVDYLLKKNEEWVANREVMAALEGESFSAYEAFEERLSLAIGELQAFVTDGQEDRLWQSQQSLLEGMLTYDLFIHSLNGKEE